MASDQNKSVSTAVLIGSVLYILFVFSYVWFLPNYNLLRLGGRHIANSNVAFKTGNHNHYNGQADNGIWLEKISKTTPENKRAAGLALLGAFVLVSLAVFTRSWNALLNPGYRQGSGYGIFAHQYAYLSLRTFRI